MRKFGWYILAGCVLLILAGFVAFWFVIHYKAEGLLREALKTRTTENLHIDFERIRVHILNRSVRVTGLQITQSWGDTIHWRFHAGDLQLEKLHYSSLDGKAQLNLGSVSISNAFLAILHASPRFEFSATDTAIPASDTSPLERLAIDSLIVHRSRFHFQPSDSIEGEAVLSCHAHGIVFSTGKPDISAARCNVLLEGVEWSPPDIPQSFSAERMHVDVVNRQALAENIQVRDKRSKLSFFKNGRYRESRVEMDISSISLSGLHIDTVNGHSIGRIVMDGVNVDMLRDNTLPFRDRVTEMPQAILSDFPHPFHIDSLILKHGTLDITLMGKHSNVSNSLQVAAVHAKIGHLQNFNYEKPAFHAVAQGRFMNVAQISLDTEYRYGINHPWELHFDCGDLELEKLNDAIASQAGILLEDGRLHHIEMHLHGNTHQCSGSLIMNYEALEMGIANDAEKERSGIVRWLVDHLGGLFYFKENPEHQKVRIASIDSPRDVKKDFPGQWLDALLEGIGKSISKLEGKTNKERRKRRN